MSNIFKPAIFKVDGTTTSVTDIINTMTMCRVSKIRPTTPPTFSPSMASLADDDIDMFGSTHKSSYKIVEHPLKSVSELDYIHSILKISKAQLCLTRLYTDTMKEGLSDISFKRDLGAVLKLFIGDIVSLNPTNYIDGYACDCAIGAERIVFVHCLGGFGLPVKAHWMSSTKSSGAIHNHFHLLIVYFDTVFKKFTIVCISGGHHRAILLQLKDRAFINSTSYDGGVEYSSEAMKELLKRPYFIVEINDVELNSNNPIERRIKELIDLGLGP